MLKLKEMSKLKVSISLLLTVVMVASILVIGSSPPEREEVRMGAWLDEIVATETTVHLAVPKLQAGEIDVFTGGIVDPEKIARVRADPKLAYVRAYGGFVGLAMNAAGTPENPVFRDGRLNPFAILEIRRAIQFLIDRPFLVEEFWHGLAVPRFIPLHPIFPDYIRHIETARAIELYYAYNPARGKAMLAEQMYKLGAERIDGIWHWQGKPVEIRILGATDFVGEPLARHLGALFERLGFKVHLMIKTWAERAPLWLRGCAYDGLMHLKVAGWVHGAISRDQAATFNFHYTLRTIPRPYFMARKPSPELDYLADRLARRDFVSLAERQELFEAILHETMKCSLWVWLTSTASLIPHRADFVLAADLAGGITGSDLLGLTGRFVDPVTGEPVVGGTLRLASGPGTMVPSPWNPIDGCNLVNSHMFYSLMGDVGLMMDPHTGLTHPQRIERATVYVKEGLPVGITLDWLDLHFVPRMEVPADTWVDWCAVEQRFITLAEARERPDFDFDRVYADVMTRVYYPADLFDTVKWHCGSPLHIADFLIGMIMAFERANPDSPIFDRTAVPGFTAFMGHFRGVRIVSEDPLIIETYTNRIFMDAEWLPWDWFPYFARGAAGWHNLTVGILAEANRELAFTAAKARDLGVEWMSFIAGPSLPILERHMLEARAANFIPFAPTIGQFITTEQVAARWDALKNWFEARGHFQLGTGAFYLVAAHPIERIVHLRRNPYFVDPAERWVGFAAPRIAEVEVIGPTVVRAGTEAVFDIEVTFEGELYPVADVDLVTYLLIDVVGDIVYVGTAVAVRDGLWRVVLPAEKTAGLAIGSTRLEVVVAPRIVTKATFANVTFMLLP